MFFENEFRAYSYKIWALTVLCVSLVFGCAGDGPSSSGSAGSSDLKGSGSLQQDGGGLPGEVASDAGGTSYAALGGILVSVTVTENPRNLLSAIVTLELAEPLAAAVAFQSSDVAEQITGASDAATFHEIVVVGMRADSIYNLTPVVFLADGREGRDSPKSFTTGSLPPGVHEMNVTIHQPDKVQPGITLFGPTNPQKDGDTTPDYVGVDSSGAVVWYYIDDTATQGIADHIGREARQLPDGNLLLLLRSGYRVVTPGGESVRNIAGHDGVVGCNVGLGDIHHDIDIMPNGNALVLSSEVCPVDGTPMGDNVLLIADTLFEIDLDGEVQWEWHALNVLDPTRFPGLLSMSPPHGPNAQGFDWTHANSVTYLPEDDSALISLRHQNWVVKIDCQTQKPDWILGDSEGEGILAAFSLADGGDWFYSQHAPVLDGEGRILIYDNGNERPGEPNSYSRAVIYGLDEESLEATQLWEYRTEAYTGFLGDANWLPNGNVLVAVGAVFAAHDDAADLEGPPSGPPQPGMAQIVEVTSDDARGADAKVWELQVEAFVYRANRIVSFWPQDADKK